jgi:hypothetical protein
VISALLLLLLPVKRTVTQRVKLQYVRRFVTLYLSGAAALQFAAPQITNSTLCVSLLRRGVDGITSGKVLRDCQRKSSRRTGLRSCARAGTAGGETGFPPNLPGTTYTWARASVRASDVRGPNAEASLASGGDVQRLRTLQCSCFRADCPLLPVGLNQCCQLCCPSPSRREEPRKPSQQAVACLQATPMAEISGSFGSPTEQ